MLFKTTTSAEGWAGRWQRRREEQQAMSACDIRGCYARDEEEET